MGCASDHPSLHQSLVVRVCGVADHRDHDHGTTKKAFAKRDRQKTKRPTAGGKTVNKSCDTCSIKKRRCDGGRPCSRCVSRGGGHKCTYSTRRPYTPKHRPARLWGSSISSPGQTAEEVASATSGSPFRKCSIDSDCHDVKDQQITRHQPLAPPAVSKGYMENISDNSSSVVEAAPPPDGPTETLKSKCSSVAINGVYPELALAQQSVMSVIVSSLSLHASKNGPYQQTTMKKRLVPCCELDEACDIGVEYAEMIPRTTMSLEGQNNQKSSDIPGLEIDCPVPASLGALVRDVSIEEDDDISSTLDLDVKILPSTWSDDDANVVHDVPVIWFDQQLLPPTSENTADITTGDKKLAVTKGKSFSALEIGEQEVISAEDWFQFAATL